MAARNIKDVVADMLTALEEVGLNGIWAIFAETPDVVVMQREGGYEFKLFAKFVRLTIVTDNEFNVKYTEVEYD
jgi:hypothetical protein